MRFRAKGFTTSFIEIDFPQAFIEMKKEFSPLEAYQPGPAAIENDRSKTYSLSIRY